MAQIGAIPTDAEPMNSQLANPVPTPDVMVSSLLNDVSESLFVVLGCLDRATRAVDQLGLSAERCAPANLDACAPRLRVLVVDDSATIRELMLVMLRLAGHEAEAQGTAAGALGRLEAATFDVVISDLSLGRGMNGWNLARCIAEHWPGVGFVLATGCAEDLDRAQLASCGVDAVLAKPFRGAQLRETVLRVAMGHTWMAAK